MRVLNQEKMRRNRTQHTTTTTWLTWKFAHWLDMECWEHRPFPKLLPAAAQRLKLWANTVWKTTFRLSLLTCLDIEGLVAAASCTLCHKKFMVDNITFLHLAQYETIIFTINRSVTLRKMVGPSRIILLRRMREQLCLLDPGVLDVLGVNLTYSRFQSLQISTHFCINPSNVRLKSRICGHAPLPQP